MATGSIKKHVAKDGTVSYRVRIDAGIDPVTGKRKQPMRTFKTKKEAEAARSQWHAEIERGTAVEPSRQTVGEYLQRWLQGKRPPTLRPTTYRMYEYHITKYVLPELGALPLQKLTPATLHDFLASAKTPNVGKVSHRLLHIALGQAVDLGLLAINPLDRVKPPKAPKPRRGAWDASQAARFLDVAADDPYQPLWTLALYTGLRRGELIGLRWDDVDLDTGTLRVRQQIADLAGKGEVQVPKTESGHRAIDLPAEVIDVLRTHRIRQKERQLAARVWHDRGLVSTAANGEAIGPRNASRRFQVLRKKADLPDLTLHGTRHTAATVMLAAGMQMHDVSAILGHSTPATTAQIYAQSLREQRRKATHALADALKEGRKKAR